MHRLARPVAALFALWFAIVLGDPGVLHACPMHSAHGAVAPATQEHAAHAHGAAAQVAAGEHTQAPADAAPCTCIGHCCAVSVATPITAAEVLVATTDVALPPVRLPIDVGDVPAAPDVRLPFANGPPRA